MAAVFSLRTDPTRHGVANSTCDCGFRFKLTRTKGEGYLDFITLIQDVFHDRIHVEIHGFGIQ